MQVKAQPYEFLARWDTKTGLLSGAHVQISNVILNDDGSFNSEVIGAAMPVAVGAASGYPLEDILQAIHVSAIGQMESANAELNAAKIEAEAARSEMTNMRDAHAAELELRNSEAGKMKKVIEEMARQIEDLQHKLQKSKR